MDRMQVAKALVEHMQAAHRLWDAYREQGGDPQDLVEEARAWRADTGKLLRASFQDESVADSFLSMTQEASRLDNPFELFKTGLQLLEALLRDIGVEEQPRPAPDGSAASGGDTPSTSGAPGRESSSEASPSTAEAVDEGRVSVTQRPSDASVEDDKKTEEEGRGVEVRATVGVVSSAGGSAPDAGTAAATTGDSAADSETSRVLGEVRVAIEMTPLPEAARKDHLVQLSQLERVFRSADVERDVALGRSAIRSLMHAADKVPNTASRLMALLDALEG